MGLDWMDGWLSYTAVTPRASLKSDANKYNNHHNDDEFRYGTPSGTSH